MKYLPILVLFVSAILSVDLSAQDVKHPVLGARFERSDFGIMFTRRYQSYMKSEGGYDASVSSPKAVTMHPSNGKFYVSSLEGFSTTVYSIKDYSKLNVIKYDFTSAQDSLWAENSGYYAFTRNYDMPNTFSGKPVESILSHGGRYLWVSFYRRSYDQSAKEPSAIVCIDTFTDSFVRVFQTGALPKFIAENDGYIAICCPLDKHVAFIDIHSDNPSEWKYSGKVDLGFEPSCISKAPDGRFYIGGVSARYLAVVNPAETTVGDKITCPRSNPRAVCVCGEYLYACYSDASTLQRIKLSELEGGVWQSCKVAAGPRNMAASVDGNYIFVLCNTACCMSVVKTTDFKHLCNVDVDSFPVGIAISFDGKTLVTTSQGRNGSAGNAVDIFKLNFR